MRWHGNSVVRSKRSYDVLNFYEGSIDEFYVFIIHITEHVNFS